MKRASKLSITYSDDFKDKFIGANLIRELPRKIFKEHGFDIDIIGLKRIEQSAYRWKKACEKDGLIGLADTRSINSDRPQEKRISKEEIIKKQEAKIKLLEGQVDLLKKLEMTERRLLSKGENMRISEKFQLIESTLTRNNF